jgi:8-amino-7-oxononanoate synthase
MPSASPLEHRIRARLAALGAGGLLRSLAPPKGIDLSSNDYLNLSGHPAVGARLIEAIQQQGTGSTGSRLLRGEREAFASVERRFARFKGTDRALFFGSGYLANLAVLSTLVEPGDVVFSDEHNHASLIDGLRLAKARKIVFPHRDTAALRAAIEQERGDGGAMFVVTESLFSMEGDMAPLAEYAAICESAGSTLVVDEAHAVGVYGASGSGLLEDASVDANACVSINTAGKALGVGGAFVAGPRWAIEYLVQRARPFVFTTAPPPAMAEAIDASLDLVVAEPERRRLVRNLAVYLRAELAATGMPAGGTGQILSLLIGDNERAVAVAAAVQDAGFDVRAIRPPSVPPGTARLRISVNAGLTEDVLDRFVAALAIAMKEAGVCSAGSS